MDAPYPSVRTEDTLQPSRLGQRAVRAAQVSPSKVAPSLQDEVERRKLLVVFLMMGTRANRRCAQKRCLEVGWAVVKVK